MLNDWIRKHTKKKLRAIQNLKGRQKEIYDLLVEKGSARFEDMLVFGHRYHVARALNALTRRDIVCRDYRTREHYRVDETVEDLQRWLDNH